MMFSVSDIVIEFVFGRTEIVCYQTSAFYCWVIVTTR
jgi:hypothetical protein